MKLNVWSPLPPSASGIADYVAEQLPALAARSELTIVVEDPGQIDPGLRADFAVAAPEAPPAGGLDLYHLGNSPAHGYVYRRAIREPGVAFLHEFNLHDLVLSETAARGDRSAYLREMRRAYGEPGSFLGGQIVRALGAATWSARFPLSEHIVRRSLAAVGLTQHVVDRVREVMPEDRPLLRLPHHVALPIDPPPSRAEARQALGLAPDRFLIVAPGLATGSKRLDVAIRALRRLPDAELVIAGAVDPLLPVTDWVREARVQDSVRVTGRLTLENFERHLAAADVVLALRQPHRGEISGALVRSLGIGRVAIVSAGSPAAEEFPEGLVVPVDPGPAEEEQIVAVVERLAADPALKETMERLAREHMAGHHQVPATVASLVSFLESIAAGAAATREAIIRGRAPEGSLREYLQDEVLFGAYDLGLAGIDLGVDALVDDLTEGRR